MTKGRYPYPDDEFDAVDASVGPRGVHRAPLSRWSRLWPFLLVIVLFPALAFGVVTYVFNWDGLGSDSDSGVSQDASQDVDGSVDDGAGDEGTDAGATEGTDEGAAEEPAVETPPVVEADLSLPVEVLNAAKVSGLAAKAGAKLTAAGFTSVTPGNYTGAATTTSGVYYASEDQQPTAAEAAAALGITKVELSTTQAADGITVVLASDFTL